jgi:hypothetical protein
VLGIGDDSIENGACVSVSKFAASSPSEREPTAASWSNVHERGSCGIARPGDGRMWPGESPFEGPCGVKARWGA